MSSLANIRFNHFFVALKVLALSVVIMRGFPRLATNLLIQRINVATDKSDTNSRCKALVVLHVKRAI